jgi:hypothetical protein
MTIRVYHQNGHNAKWNIDSFESENCGDGLILSPVHQTPENIEKLSAATRKSSLFDPQFYLPSSQKPKLLQYDFFPVNIAQGGFSTTTFESSVKESAKRCVEYQRGLNLRRITVPTRFLDQMYTNYVDRQKVFTVDAFMEQISNDEEVCLSLAVTDAMLQDEGFRTKILSWITSYSNVHELYLIYSAPRETKQIQSSEMLIACHRLGQEMQEIGLELTWGHQNTEALLATAQGDVAVTMGSFENTRIFSTDKFVVTNEDRRGPKARIFLKGLLNWIQFEQAKEIRSNLPNVWKKIYSPTQHAEAALKLVVEPTFNQAPLYKHYFLNLTEEIKALSPLPLSDRKKYLREKIEYAQASYAEIAKTIQLEKHGQGTHLAPWLKAVDAF